MPLVLVLFVLTSLFRMHVGDRLLIAILLSQAGVTVVSGLAKLQSQSPLGRLSVFLGVAAGDWFGEELQCLVYEVCTEVPVASTALGCIGAPAIDGTKALPGHFKPADIADRARIDDAAAGEVVAIKAAVLFQ